MLCQVMLCVGVWHGVVWCGTAGKRHATGGTLFIFCGISQSERAVQLVVVEFPVCGHGADASANGHWQRQTCGTDGFHASCGLHVAAAAICHCQKMQVEGIAMDRCSTVSIGQLVHHAIQMLPDSSKS